MDVLLKKTVNRVNNANAENTVIGVLALQGAFREHINAIKKCGAAAREIKLPNQLDTVDGLIIPGGESTTIFKLLDKYNFRPALEKFYKQKKPIFGTCAGLILLAKEVKGDSFGLGYIDITVDRNAYGRQVDSFEVPVELKIEIENEPEPGFGNAIKSELNTKSETVDATGPEFESEIELVSETKFEPENVLESVTGNEPELKRKPEPNSGPDTDIDFIFKSGAGHTKKNSKFNAVFIRAPKIEKTGEKVQVLSRADSVPVLARQENVLVCSFHPELTGDLRIHQYFIDMVIKSKNMIKLNSSD